jgi:hypothetical protein
MTIFMIITLVKDDNICISRIFMISLVGFYIASFCEELFTILGALCPIALWTALPTYLRHLLAEATNAPFCALRPTF